MALLSFNKIQLAWVCRKSLDLLELLLKLAEVGHYHQVLELFKFPVQQCPDLLVLGLIQLVSIITFANIMCG